jgi:hypothetical protein
MKRLVAVVALSTLFSLAAFAVLVTADRQLRVPLPYSIPWSLTAVSVVAPLMFAIANAVRMRRPVVIKVKPVAPPPAPRAIDSPAARRRAQGVVLLDFSSAKKVRERAA